MLPVTGELDRKKAAALVGEKSPGKCSTFKDLLAVHRVMSGAGVPPWA